MTNDFNSEHYLNLFNTPTELLTVKEKRQLRQYEETILCQLYYNGRGKYFSLIDEYIELKITANLFRAEFYRMANWDREMYDEILANPNCHILKLNLKRDPDCKRKLFLDLFDLIDENTWVALNKTNIDRKFENEFQLTIEKAFSNLDLFK